MAVTKQQSKVCGSPMGGNKTCTKKTKHATGKCHLHRAGSAGNQAGTSSLAGSDAEAIAASTEANALTMTADGEEAVLPLPAEGPEAGDPLGTSFMVADGEIEDSAMTAQRYLASPNSTDHYDMVHLKLNPEGEQKMLDALGLNSTVTKLVDEKVDGSGVHPLDEQHQLAHQVETIARSYNARLKKGETLDEIRQTNNPRVEKLQSDLEAAAGKAEADDEGAQKMLAHYQGHIDEFNKRMADGYEPPPYQEGGKIPPMAGWHGDYTTTVQKEVAVPNPDVDEALLPTVEVEGKRVNPKMDETGKTSWSPAQMTKQAAPDKMWEVDLGDGYKALYYPQQYTKDAAKGGSGAGSEGSSMRRRMTVISPKNGDAQTALKKMQNLHLNTSPMTREGAEFTYLDRNAHTLNLNSNSDVMQARVEAASYSMALAQDRVQSRAHEAVGMDPQQQRAWLREQRVAAEAEALPFRAKRLREGMAKAMGYSSGAELKKDKRYNPMPVKSDGKPYFERLPEGKNGSQQLSDRHFYMNITGGDDNIVEVARAGGVTASQERRRLMGVHKSTMSPGADVKTRGASGVFMHMNKGAQKHKPSGVQVVWSGEQAERLSRRSDYWVTPGDHYGSTNAGARALSQIEGFHSGEAMFEDTVSFRANPPTYIGTGNKQRRAQVIKHLKDSGLSQFDDGRTVEEVVV